MKRNLNPLVILSLLSLLACSTNNNKQAESKALSEFNSNTLIIKDSSFTKKVRGQLLYMPIYSEVPHLKEDRKFDLSAFVSIHNTDLEHSIKITKILFFDNDGKLVANYLPTDTLIHSLGAANFFIPEKIKSGTGANLLIEWISDIPVHEPLIESISLSLTGGQGISFLSQGKVIREIK